MLESIKFDNFTAFDTLKVSFSKGINIFIGENGTGKTHVLKAIYAACDITQSEKHFAEKIAGVFYPSKKQIGRLVKRSQGTRTCSLSVQRQIGGKEHSLKLSFSNHAKRADQTQLSGAFSIWKTNALKSAYIPVKDMLANAQGFISLNEHRELCFEEIYSDIIKRSLLPALIGPPSKERARLLSILRQHLEGKVIVKNEEFFLKSPQGELEFTLLAEGMRKLGLLWVLIQNGTLTQGSVLCWDEPEANLNPNLMRIVVKLLIALQRMGVQIFVATHDYVTLKEFDLQAENDDAIQYHSLYRDQDKKISVASTSRYLELNPNAIDESLSSLLSREIEKSMGTLGKKIGKKK